MVLEILRSRLQLESASRKNTPRNRLALRIRMTIGFLLGVAAPAAVGAAITAIGTARIETAHPASGRLIEVTGGWLHVLELGATTAQDRLPVVLVHGASGNLEDMRVALG